MRVVAGSARGRQLVAPDGERTRPTADRVRESVFNMLAARGLLGEIDVLDCYAGSGALGIEALSRGAESATFVDRDRAAIAAVEENLDTLDMAGRARVHRTEVCPWLEVTGETFDLVFADPPYDLDEWERFLVAVGDRLEPDGAVVCESATPPAVTDGWRIVSERTYGGTVITILQPDEE